MDAPVPQRPSWRIALRHSALLAAAAPARVADVRLIAVAVGIVTAMLYGFTAHWDAGGRVNPGDSAKFQYLPIVNGTPHATGYPTYLMIGRLLYWALPFVPASVRATAISVVCASCASALVFLWCAACTNRVTASLGAVALVASGTNFWLAATDAEIYALHLLFYSSVVLYLTRALNGTGRSPLRIALVLYALSFGNHLTTIALAPAVAWVVWVLERRRLWRPRTLAIGGSLALLAIGQYAYIYYLSHWGGGRDLEFVRHDVSLERLAQYITGQQFKARFFAYSPMDVVTVRLPEALNVVIKQLSIAGATCAVFGVVLALARPCSTRFIPVVVLTLAAQLFIAVNYRVESALYLTPIAVLLSPIVALGLSCLLRWWLVAPVALALVASQAHASYTNTFLRPWVQHAAQLRWYSAEAVGCRSLIAGPPDYHYAQVRKYLRYTGDYPLATPFSSISEVGDENGLCVDKDAKLKLERRGYRFRPQRDSLREFFARNRDKTLLLALSTDHDLSEETRGAFEQMGSAASGLRAGGAYVAIIHRGRTVAERLSGGRPVRLHLDKGDELGGFAPRRPIDLQADGAGSSGKASVWLAGAERRTARRSARFVILDSKQSVVGEATVRASELDDFHLYYMLDSGPAKSPGRINAAAGGG